MSRAHNAEYWKETLRLKEHPEGGWFVETYRSAETIEATGLPDRFGGRRAISTAIYFLLTSAGRSRFHRLQADELWHFHAGGAVTLYIIDQEGELHRRTLGPDPDAGQSFQAVIPAGCWFGALVDDPDGYTLVGCTVAPGFDFADFEMGERAALVERYPRHREIIERLTAE